MTSTDQTFQHFTPSQAAAYAQHRGTSYPQGMYDTILNYHNGPKNLCCDVGTGPGRALFDLLSHFANGIGVDPGESMIAQATASAEEQGLSPRVCFLHCGAEQFASALRPEELGKVDLITAATAVHWFDLPKFYAQAALALRPGGTMAFWTYVGNYAHPSEPQHEAIQKLLDGLRGQHAQYMTDGNRLATSGYKDMLMPWDTGLSDLFYQADFVRHDWDTNGVPTATNDDGSPGPYLRMQLTNINDWETAAGTISAVIRWREAHPDLAGTDKDIVRILVEKMRTLLGGRVTFWSGSSVVLLLMRRSSVGAKEAETQ